MPIADDWTINYTDKAISHFQFDGTASVAEDSTVTCVAVSGNISTGDYFNLYSAKDETAYYVWYNVASGGGDPNIAGKTGIEVAVGGSDTADQVATATRSAINTEAGSDFTASGSGADADILNDNPGSTTDVANGSGLNEFTYAVSTQGRGETVWTVNQLYSHLQDTFDETAQMDDFISMSAQTPFDYTLINNWFIDEISIHFLSGGTISTIGWDATTENSGIRILTLDSGTYTNAVVGDLGREVGYSGGTPSDTGTLLFYDNSLRKWWVRVDDTGDTFANTATNIDLDDGAGTGGGDSLTVASVTGENQWSNIFTLGTLQANTNIYVVQNFSKISAWWQSGQIDVLVLTTEAGTEFDSGKLTIFARHYSKLYDHFSVDTSGGGRTPVPLATFRDTSNQSGYREFDFDNGSGGTLLLAEVITENSDPNTQGIVTAVTGASSATGNIEYYLFGDPLTDFADNDNVTATTSGKTFDVDGSPANVGPATLSGVTITFGATSQDINNGNGSRPYDVTVDCDTLSLNDVYQRLKYLTRRGSTTSINGHDGEQYKAVGDLRLPYDAQTANYTQGLTVTGGTSGATGIIVADHDAGSTGALVLRDVNGIFIDNEIITDTSSGSATTNNPGDLDVIAANKQAPFGTFAGGVFIAARGVFLTNMAPSDASNYILTDSEGIEQIPPSTVVVEVTGLVAGDRVTVFRSTGAGSTDVNKSLFTSASGNSSGNSTFVVNETLPPDLPTSGMLRIVDASDRSINRETRYFYVSFAGSTFQSLSPTLDRTYSSGADTAYVGFLDSEATGTSLAITVIYDQDRDLVTRARKYGGVGSSIVPFVVAGTLTTSGYSQAAIRTSDNIVE